jgi:hypothetical protein
MRSILPVLVPIGLTLTSASAAAQDTTGVGAISGIVRDAGARTSASPTRCRGTPVGVYYQQPACLFVSSFPQNASLVPWRANHFVTGSGRPYTPSDEAVSTAQRRGVACMI